jgi:hypothetical protein
MDFDSGGPYTRRGDRITTGRTLYFVLYARKIRRRDPNASKRIQMRVIRTQDMTEGLEERLLRAAVRDHQDSLIFSLSWYPRSKKTMNFEQYMKQGNKRCEHSQKQIG